MCIGKVKFQKFETTFIIDFLLQEKKVQNHDKAPTWHWVSGLEN